MTAAGAVAYMGWKGGGWAARQVISLIDRVSEAVGRKTGSQAAADAVRLVPKLALGLGVAGTGSIGLDGLRMSLAVPAAAYLAFDSLLLQA